jgi:hypothetical protein
MDTMSAKRKTTLLLAALGFGITAIIWAYSFSSRTFSLPLWTAFVVLCPPSLLPIPLIDVAWIGGIHDHLGDNWTFERRALRNHWKHL